MCWTHVILEGYCTRTLSSKKDKFIYKVTDVKKFKTEKENNPEYDSKYRMPKKPKYCPNIPQYICLENDCSHFGYTDAEKEDYLWMNKKYKKGDKIC